MNNSLSLRMSRALGLWAAILVLLMGLWADIDPATVMMRGAVGFLVFFAVGYVSGLLIHNVLLDESQAEETIHEKDSKDAGEAMESV